MTTPPQRIYVRRDGTLIPHTSRPLSARFTELLSSLVLFLTLFWQTLFQVTTPSGEALKTRLVGVMRGRAVQQI